jgi:hypothetical protein
MAKSIVEQLAKYEFLIPDISEFSKLTIAVLKDMPRDFLEVKVFNSIR